MTIACHVRIVGHVQGVFFRAWTRDEARRLELLGWVRNCSDGSVEAHLEGDVDSIERMVALLHDGPVHAKVRSVDVTEAELEDVRDFEVRH
jgi:acylphosphatase